MEYFHILGGKKLAGSIPLAGSKNLASKLMIASLLTADTCELTNVPDIGENQLAQQLVKLTGGTVERSGTSLSVSGASVSRSDVRDAPRNRLPVLVIAPLLLRLGEAIVPQPGGDKIGTRPINFHTDILTTLGASVRSANGLYHVTADRLLGAELPLPYPSVGATETALLATVWAQGESVIRGAAIEPEVLELIGYLKAMGASIRKTGEREFTIQGVRDFHGASQRVIPDRIEAVSYVSLALATGGSLELTETDGVDISTFSTFVESIGAQRQESSDHMKFWIDQPLTAGHVVTGVHPGFMTDWQQPTTVMLLTASGHSTVQETVHERRFGYIDELNKMGAAIRIEQQPAASAEADARLFATTEIAHVDGPAQLIGRTLTMPDLRAGLAYISAALVAQGQSKIYGVEQVDRGYDSIVEKLQSLGAEIERRVE